MYAILVKDNNNIYDVLGVLKTDETIRPKLDLEWEKNLPIIGMDVDAHKATATRGATWNGTSFDGTANEGFFALSQEEKDAYNQYAFLCDNKIVHRIAITSEDERKDMYKAAFSSEVILVKCTFVTAGVKVAYDEVTREISPV
jgi:hypothetical protein